MSLALPPGDWTLSDRTPPAAEPITVAAAKRHLRIDADIDDFDEDVALYIASARSYLESAYNMRFVRQTVAFTLQQFPRANRFRLPIWPVQSFDALTFRDTLGNVTPMLIGTDVLARLNRKPCEIILAWEKIWPTTILQTDDPIELLLTVGYGRGDSPETLPLPPAGMQALRLMIDHQFRNTSAVTLGSLNVSEELVLAVDAMMSNVGLIYY